MYLLGGMVIDDKCLICGGKMVDNHKDGFVCLVHRNQRATTVKVVFTRVISKRFRGPDCYDAAGYFLAGLRFKFSEGSYDPRDYQASKPLSFSILAQQYLDRKQHEIKPSSFTKLRSDMSKAMIHFGGRNVKEIDYAALEEDVDLERRCIWVRDHKTVAHTQSPKVVALLDEDIAFIKSLPRSFPKMPFFRRELGSGGRHANMTFGRHFLLDVWNRACRNLGIDGVGLYGGTRHTTCQ